MTEHIFSLCKSLFLDNFSQFYKKKKIFDKPENSQTLLFKYFLVCLFPWQHKNNCRLLTSCVVPHATYHHPKSVHTPETFNMCSSGAVT